MSGLAQTALATLRLAALIRKTQPTTIQSWLYYADLLSLWALRISGRSSGTPLYWGVRCSDMDQSQYRLSLRWAIRLCAKWSARPNAVVANSCAGRDVHRRLGYSPRAFPVIWNGIDTDRFRPDANIRARVRREFGLSETDIVVIHVARVDPMKDHASLLDVAAALPDIKFIAVGRGTKELSGPRNLIALGHRSDLPMLYPVADCLLSTSAFGEGFPNVIGEAMACALPIVATDTGDSRIIVGDNGIIVPCGDTGAMASAIRTVTAETGSQRQDCGLRGRRRIETCFSIERAVSAFDRLHVDGILPTDPTVAT
jgi:glycosyltransferase involved in cell wall biosynthesis